MRYILVLLYLFLIQHQAFGLELLSSGGFRDLSSWKKSNPSLDPASQVLTFPRIKVSRSWDGVAPYKRREYFIFLQTEGVLSYAQIVGECVRDNKRPSDVYIALGSIPLKYSEDKAPYNLHLWGEQYDITQNLIVRAMSYLGYEHIPDFCTSDFENLLRDEYKIENLVKQVYGSEEYTVRATEDSVYMKLLRLP